MNHSVNPSVYESIARLREEELARREARRSLAERHRAGPRQLKIVAAFRARLRRREQRPTAYRPVTGSR